jgi:hypothetical protein
LSNVPVDENKEFVVILNERVFKVRYKISSKGLVHYNRKDVSMVIGDTADETKANNIYYPTIRDSSKLKNQSHPQKYKKADTAWLTDLGVEHMCDYHRKSREESVWNS